MMYLHFVDGTAKLMQPALALEVDSLLRSR
jgi:hypothetical protein